MPYVCLYGPLAKWSIRFLEGKKKEGKEGEVSPVKVTLCSDTFSVEVYPYRKRPAYEDSNTAKEREATAQSKGAKHVLCEEREGETEECSEYGSS